MQAVIINFLNEKDTKEVAIKVKNLTEGLSIFRLDETPKRRDAILNGNKPWVCKLSDNQYGFLTEENNTGYYEMAKAKAIKKYKERLK